MRALIPTMCALVASAAGACVYDWSLPAGEGGSGATSAGAAGDPATGPGGAGGDPTGGGAGAVNHGGSAGAPAQGGGGSMPAICQPSVGDDPCTECLRDDCCSQLESCEGDSSCECWAECIAGGGDCFARCPEETSPAANQLAICAFGPCAGFCL